MDISNGYYNNIMKKPNFSKTILVVMISANASTGTSDEMSSSSFSIPMADS